MNPPGSHASDLPCVSIILSSPAVGAIEGTSEGCQNSDSPRDQAVCTIAPRGPVDPVHAAPEPVRTLRRHDHSRSLEGCRDRDASAPSEGLAPAGGATVVPPDRWGLPRRREPRPADGPLALVPYYPADPAPVASRACPAEVDVPNREEAGVPQSTPRSRTSCCAWRERTTGGVTSGSRGSSASWASGLAQRRSGGCSELTGWDPREGCLDDSRPLRVFPVRDPNSILHGLQ